MSPEAIEAPVGPCTHGIFPPLEWEIEAPCALTVLSPSILTKGSEVGDT